MFSTEYRRLVRATAAAMAATSLCWWATRLTGSTLTVSGRDPSMPTPVPWAAVLLATAAGGVAAYALARLATRTVRPRRTFAAAVTAGLALSSLPPVLAATTTGTALVLLVMHLVAATMILPPAAPTLQPQSVAPSQPTGLPR